MQDIHWRVDGMDCTNCALTVRRYLEKEGAENVKVNFVDGDVSFKINTDTPPESFQKGINDLGYKVTGNIEAARLQQKPSLNIYLKYTLWCLPFTLVLFLHMFHGVTGLYWLMNPWVQLTLCIPVYATGMSFFGRSAWKSLRNGIPNMNVLIAVGATAAFVYSLIGTLGNLGEDYLFYETTATIITLVFFGNYLESASIQSTQKALNKLAISQKITAHMIAFDEHHQEIVMPVESADLRPGDLILIRNGDQVPADCKIFWGNASIDESIITGESMPLEKEVKDTLIGGSILVNGTVKASVIAAANDSTLANITDLVKQAQGEKPPVQQLADKISAVFVPLVIGIAVVTLVVNYIILHDFTSALMRSIAVLVIACPCALGLATPAAVAVGLGRAARNGVLFRNARSLELFKNIRQVVFDKTGTLTTGELSISHLHLVNNDLSEEEVKRVVYSLEKYSNHPIAKVILKAWKTKDGMQWQNVEEDKGLGIKALSKEGDEYAIGSYKVAAALTTDREHNIYIVKNNRLLAWVDIKDSIRPEAKPVIDYLQKKGIKTILLSGDTAAKCNLLADELGIDTVFAEQSPAQKLAIIESLANNAPTAMVGDGINDAPALAKATIGISMSDASQIAVQTADVVLMNKGLKNLPLALGLGKHTFLTIKQNLFWAFAYNIVAIPLAALGFLNPMLAALAMGFSDVVLAINSGRLFVKKV
ncbi:MAG: cadmium-translocating P-type ATPase [Chitinophagaceae bacterium]|nr:cadmium-translocating P-type ATPase [Chitinophagaceae bacterium]MCW5925494.1 cadmium-translocating P-type ATPase [Chitinophagaceae bacterium]